MTAERILETMKGDIQEKLRLNFKGYLDSRPSQKKLVRNKLALNRFQLTVQKVLESQMLHHEGQDHNCDQVCGDDDDDGKYKYEYYKQKTDETDFVEIDSNDGEGSQNSEDVQKVINMPGEDGHCYSSGYVEWLKREKKKVAGNKELKVLLGHQNHLTWIERKLDEKSIQEEDLICEKISPAQLKKFNEWKAPSAPLPEWLDNPSTTHGAQPYSKLPSYSRNSEEPPTIDHDFPINALISLNPTPNPAESKQNLPSNLPPPPNPYQTTQNLSETHWPTSQRGLRSPSPLNGKILWEHPSAFLCRMKY